MRDGTDPVPVTVGGYDGLYVERSVTGDRQVWSSAGSELMPR